MRWTRSPLRSWEAESSAAYVTVVESGARALNSACTYVT